METKTRASTDVEGTLTRLLEEGGVDKNRLSAFVKTIAAMYKAGMHQMRPFPIGIPPVYDSVRVEGILELQQTEQLLHLVTSQSLIERLHIFPLGIPAVTSFRVGVDIGNVREGGVRQE